MPATPIRIEITARDLEGPPKVSGGTYSEIEVPGDYELTLAAVEDYDYRDRNMSYGWIFTYQVETSTGPCDFKQWISHSTGARWKMLDLFRYHTGENVALHQIKDFDPNTLIGTKVGGHIDFPRDKDGEPTKTYREIMAFFPLVEPPANIQEEAPRTLEALDAPF